MSPGEFLSRWKQQLELTQAELIDRIVHIPLPIEMLDGKVISRVRAWIEAYAAHTAGCKASANTTWLMLDDVPQPDGCLRLDSEDGRRWRLEGEYLAGAPDLITEVCQTDTEVDFGPKLRLYERARVKEYITFETLPPAKVTWRVLNDGSYVELKPDNGVFRSTAFPGLWLDWHALFKNETRLVEVLQQGLNSPEHAEFVKQLAKQNL